jgi:hypothetical protein
MDNDDLTYRYCQEVDMKAVNWDKYYFGLASKNSKNNNKQDMITDLDIHQLKFSLFDEELLPVQKIMEAERYRLLMTRKSLLDVNTGKLVGDVDELFQKGIAHEVKTQQRKNLVFLEEADILNELLFKHYETLKGFRYNIDRFNLQLEKEIKTEDEQYSHLISAKQLVKNQRLLTTLYTQAEQMLAEVREICDGTRTTLNKIIESEPAAPSEQEHLSMATLKGAYMTLDKDLTKGLDRLN